MILNNKKMEEIYFLCFFIINNERSEALELKNRKNDSSLR